MAAPFVMTVSHQLGRQEAKNRLQTGLGQVRQAFPGFHEQWAGDQMEFRMEAFRQTVTGRIEVLDDLARIELHLPGMLGWLGNTLGRRIAEHAKLMLEKK
jgi:Putative polyhydroxyalkanoic acid system protein (PHA_gran_rgn)